MLRVGVAVPIFGGSVGSVRVRVLGVASASAGPARGGVRVLGLVLIPVAAVDPVAVAHLGQGYERPDCEAGSLVTVSKQNVVRGATVRLHL